MILRELCREDIPFMLEWMHDPDINCNFRFMASDYGEKEAKAFITNANKRVKDQSAYHFAITEDGEEYLGTISLKNVDLVNQSAEYAIVLRRCAWGRGLGRLATEEILKFAFDRLGLHRVALNVLSDNFPAIHLYEKCGFIYEGEWKECLCLSGKTHSLKWYRLLRQEWQKTKENR